MANPQTENGYTRIANEIMEALAGIRISGEARQVLDVILRKTYGFQKKEDIIALSQFCLITKMGKSHVCRNLIKLATMNLIITQKGNGLGNIYRFNKDFDTWKPLPKKVTITQKGNDHYPKRTKSLPKMVHTKEKKETITKEREVTPYQEAVSFFNREELFSELLTTFSKGRDSPTIEREFKKFVLYWTEKNKGGTKERWQQENTFEVKKRLYTWLSRMDKFKGNEREPKIVLFS